MAKGGSRGGKGGIHSSRRYRAAGGGAKATAQLVREVRAAGYAVARMSGTAGTHSFGVWPKDEPQERATVLATIQAHPKFDHWLKRDRVNLIRLGILPGGKEPVMPVPGGKENTDSLVKRLRNRLKEMGGDIPAVRMQLVDRGVEVIQFRLNQGVDDVEQFGATGTGKTAPRDVARESLRGLLDKGFGATDKSFARWTAILDAIEGPTVEAAAANGAAVVEAEAEAEVATIEVEDEVPVAATDELQVELATADEAAQDVADMEQLLALAEQEAKTEKERADKAEAALATAETELADAGAQVKASADELAETAAKVKKFRDEAGRYRRERDQAKAELTTQREVVSALELLLEQPNAATEEGFVVPPVQGEEVEGPTPPWDEESKVEESQWELTTTIRQLEADLVSPIQMALMDALLTELRAANGSPGQWLLDRLDRLAGI